MSEANDLNTLLERLRARSDNAYFDYINQRRRDECLGWEIKVERNNFGITELDAHKKGGELLGRHRALHEAANLLEEFIRDNPKLTAKKQKSTTKAE